MSSQSPAKRKSQNDDNKEDEQEPEAKTARFSASEFRTKLKGTDPINALKEFFKDGNKLEKIEEYIQEGGSLSELLAILNSFDVKRNIPQAVPVFQAMTVLIIQWLNKFSDRQKELVAECRQLLSIHLALLYTMLTAIYSPRQKKVALKILTVLVSCDEALAWEILGRLNLTNQDIEALAFARKQNDPTSVREHFIHFLMAFLIDQPLALVQKFISKRGLLVSIFGGLKWDSYSDILLVLTTLKSKIVDVKQINKSKKLSVFNTASLCHLIGVYSWDPRANASHPSQTIASLEGRDEVRKCLHELLLVLLTSVKMGVVFNDPSIGTTHREFNELVTTVINGFGKPWGDEMREDLFVKMLSACPDVIKQAYRQIDPYLAQINSPRWIQGIKFFTKLISKLDVKVSMLPYKTRTNLLKSVFVPPLLLTKLTNSTVLLGDEISSRTVALTCLSTCLMRLHSYQNHLNKFTIDNYLISNLSCADVLLENAVYFSCDPNMNESESIKGAFAALDCLLYSYRLCPQLLDLIRFKKKFYEMLRDSLKRLKAKVTTTAEEDSNKETDDTPMEINSVSTDPETDVNVKLSCLKLIELILIVWPMDSSKDDYEYWLEDLSECISPHPDVVTESLSIIKQILGSTGYFIGSCEKELEVWMYCLSKHLSVDSVKLIVRSIRYTSANTKAVYSDLFKAENMIILKEQSTVALNLDDYITASQGGGGENTGISKNANIFSFSLPLLSMLKILHEETVFENSHDFVVSLIVHLLHQQATSEVFLALLKLNSGGRAVSSVIDYVQSWSDRIGSILLLPPSFPKESIFSVTSSYILGQTFQQPDVTGLSEYECEVLIAQILFCTTRGCNPSISATLLHDTLTKHSSCIPSALSYPPLLECFSPRLDLSEPSNSTLLVMTLVELSSSITQNNLAPYQHRLAFELRYSLRKKSGLKKCKTSIGKILSIIKLSEVDVEHLLENCCPLPKKVSAVCSDWRPVQEYLLKEGVRLELKLKPEHFNIFLNEVLLSVPGFSSDEDKEFLDTLCSYLEQNYAKTTWDENQTEILSGLLKALLICDTWSERLAVFLYKQTPVDLSHLPLSRFSVLLESAVSHLTSHQTSQLVSAQKSAILEALVLPEPPGWLDKLSSAVQLIDFGEGDSGLNNLCKQIVKKGSEVCVSVSTVKLLHVLLAKANLTSDMFSMAQDYLLQSASLKDVPLGEHLAEIMEDLMTKSDSLLSADLSKALLATGLKQPFPRLLHLLSTSVKLNRSTLSAKELFALLTSHSLFLSSMLDKQTQIKYELLVLLETLLRKDHSLMKSSHLPVYFSAYNATLSLHDQILLQVLKLYEENGVSLGEFKPYVWGESAVQHYSTSQNRTNLDDDEGCPTIQLLDLDIIHNTIKYFPTHRTLNGSEIVKVEKGSEIYDVVFLLGALSQAVGPGSSLFPSQIPCAGVTSLAFISLGSHCPGIRAAAYHILHRHYISLTTRKDDQIWSHLVEKMQRSFCGTENVQLSGPLSVFLARATLFMTEPLHPLYQPVHNFVLAKPIFSLKTVPAFLEFFHSPDPVNGRLLQTWILEVVRDGLRDQEDLQIVLQSFTTKLLLDFYSSNLATHKTQALIDEILERCIACDNKRQFLVKEYSLIPWFTFIKKYKQALDITPTTPKYAPIKKFIKGCLESLAKNTEEKQTESTALSYC